jgi:sugar-specific transcriptional regulator TrmB
MIEILSKVGLTPQQSQIYLALLSQGASKVSSLTRNLDIPRVSIYYSLNSLISKGFVSFYKEDKKRMFVAVDPLKILDIAKGKEKKAKEDYENLRKVLPKLEKLKESKIIEPEVSIINTKEGIKTIFSLMIKEKKTIYVISATGKALKELKYFFPSWHKKRKNQKIKANVILNKELYEQEITIPYSNTRYLPKEYSSPSTLFLFGEYVVTLVWGEVPFAFIAKSKEISQGYMKYFQLIWKQAQK